MNIYNNILKIATYQGKSIAQVEKEAGLANGSISKWQKSSPLVKRLDAVANVLNVDIKELME